MDSVIKRSIVVQDYIRQMKNKPLKLREQFEEPFYQILDRVFKRNSFNINCHVDEENERLTLNIEFKPEQKIFIEYFPNQTPNTLVTINTDQTNNFDYSHNDLYFEQLDTALDLIDESNI